MNSETIAIYNVIQRHIETQQEILQELKQLNRTLEMIATNTNLSFSVSQIKTYKFLKYILDIAFKNPQALEAMREKLSKSKYDSVLKKIAEKGDKQAIDEMVKSLIDDYNSDSKIGNKPYNYVTLPKINTDIEDKNYGKYKFYPYYKKPIKQEISYMADEDYVNATLIDNEDIPDPTEEQRRAGYNGTKTYDEEMEEYEQDKE